MLQLQQECFNNIKTLCSNYKKDSRDRKNEAYLVKRLESLDTQWSDFQQRHKLLLEKLEDKNINYFTDDVFGNIEGLYNDTKQNMEDLLQEIRERKTVLFDMTGFLDDTADETLTTLLEKQQCNFRALDRAMSKIDTNTSIEIWELQDHLSILKSKWDMIDKHHWELETKLKGSNTKYYDMFVAIEGKYDEMRRYLNSKIWSTAHYEKSSPKIEIPDFSGTYTQWISFKDLFMEAIHNNPMINKAQKMQHLKTKLRGEAERLVQHLSISADNYASCWEILNQRYDNRRLQFTSFVNTMLELPVIQNPDNHNLKKMHDVITECLNGLANIGFETSTWDPLIVHLMLQKLDPITYTDYMKELQDHREVQPLSDFLYFLESKFMAYETMKNAKKGVAYSPKQVITTNVPYKTYTGKKYYYEPKTMFKKTYVTMTYGKCPNCEGNHVLMQCPQFIDMNPAKRINMVAKLHVCKNCLYSHGGGQCPSTKTCKECNMRHHTLLHNLSTEILPTNDKYLDKNLTRPSTSTQASANHLFTDGLEILLPTVQLQIKSANGTHITLRALLDQGSQVNLITENAAQLLRLPRKRLNATISGVGSVSGDCKGRLQLTCKSIHSDFSFETQALIMKKLTNNLPNSSFTNTDWPHLQNLKLADPEFNLSRPVDLLLGADVYSDIILDGVLKGCLQSPIAQQTQLGWILCGKQKTLNCHVTLVDLSREITKYWENEDIAQDEKDISSNDYCEQHYSKTVHDENKLGQSFLQLEKRLRINKLALMYREFIKEYTELGHMKPSCPVPTNIPQCFLPHHGVLREQSTITKLRVVFNASQKTTSGFSLNQLQEKGQNLQKDIQALILKWSTYKYDLPADIQKDWLRLKTELSMVKNMKLNKWIGGSHTKIVLLGFCDASEKAYSCVIYSCFANEKGSPTITLLVAKTRVAPLTQKLTLPWLELCGALLLAQLIQKTKEPFSGHKIAKKAWRDSKVAIAWLQGDVSRWERYVANRVNKIKEIVPAENWRYVKSDCASRGMYPSKPLDFNLWWKGPDFLLAMPDEKPPTNLTFLFTNNVELKTTKQTTLAQNQDDNFIYNLLNKFSATRVMAWIRCFDTKARGSKLNAEHLTRSESMAANEKITQFVQRTEFAHEYKLPIKNDLVSSKSAIYKLNLPPGKWAMGRVLETHPGADGYVRVTTVKTQSGIIKRPIVKLSPLPLETSTETNPETESEKMNTTSSQRASKTKKVRKRNTWNSLLTTLIAMFTIITGAYGISGNLTTMAHVTSLEPDRPIYYDTVGKMQMIHDKWTLLLYYNLTNYWIGIKKIETYLHDLDDLCEKTDPRYCKTTLEQLEHELDILNYYNIVLLAPHKHLSERRKRGLINGIGSIANSLFGVLDQQFAEKYQEDIEAIQNNENYLFGLMKNQTSIVELENKVLKKTEQNINRQINMMEEFMNQTDANLAKIESTMEIMMATSYFNSASLTSFLLLKNMRTFQEMLFNTLTDVYKGHMDVHLLTPVTLIQQLNTISGKLPKSLTLPVENVKEDIKNMYKLLYAKARVTTDYFMFEVHIPLTSNEDFQLFKAIPLPVKTETRSTIVQLQSVFIAVDFRKSTYISVSEEDVKQCIQLKPDDFICFKNLPVFYLQNNNAPCEAKLLSHRMTDSTPCDVRESPCIESWIALHAPNRWLAICCGICTLRTICKGDITSFTMTTSGIVTLAQGCALQSKDFTLYSHNEYNSKIKMDDYNFNIPELNSTINNIVDLTQQRASWRVQQESPEEEMREIDNRLHSMKEHEVLPSSLSSHDIHQYVIVYTLLSAAFIVTIIWAIKKRSCLFCARKKISIEEQHKYEDLELQRMQSRPGQQQVQSSSKPPPRQPAERPRLTTPAADNIV